ncbi:sporulation protein YunB [Clostridium facile]|uniref:Sporulation protein YunB n=1 Tax=Clostridium facile TaxID=2763035 RepID=A0ABR7IPI2_9CLOT|nr:sporulation protein YunB [Clostridium facile]MBC5787026.1 sporulation protein YunB [Clostridium facile]
MPVSKNFKRSKSKRKKYGVRFIVVGIILLTSFFLLDSQLRPIVNQMAGYQAKEYATTVVNQAVSKQLEEDPESFENLSKMERLEDGTISSIQANIPNLTQIQTNVIHTITQILSEIGTTQVNIPLGNLTGMLIFSGKGPNISIQLLPQGTVHTQLTSQFEDAGINQTIHRIVLTVKIEMLALFPCYSSEVNASIDYILSENIIVGKVPQYYTQIIGESEQSLETATNHSNSQRLSSMAPETQ